MKIQKPAIISEDITAETGPHIISELQEWYYECSKQMEVEYETIQEYTERIRQEKQKVDPVHIYPVDSQLQELVSEVEYLKIQLRILVDYT